MAHQTSGKAGSFSEKTHGGVTCDACHACPIVGIRYRCSMCPDFDLCEICIRDRERYNDHSFRIASIPIHDPSHLFLRLAKTDSANAHYPVVVNRSNAIHYGVNCHVCSSTDIQGFRYHCQVCSNVDICEACEAKGGHDPSHTRLKLAVPTAESKMLADTRAEVDRLKQQLLSAGIDPGKPE